MTAQPAGRLARRSSALTGRKSLCIILLGMLGMLAALFHFFGAATVWAAWAVPTKYGGLADLREVLQGIQSAWLPSQGATTGLVSGYPGLWALFGLLGIGPTATEFVAAVIFCGFAMGLLAFARGYDSLTAVLMSAVIFSPAAMLGYERGNLDLAMFAMLGFALWLSRRWLIVSVILVVLAAMLKVYPILGLGYLLKLPRARLVQVGGVAIAVFIIYLVLVGSGTRGILTEIPKGGLFAYGTGVIPFYLFWAGLPRPQTNLLILLAFLLVYLLAMLVLFLSYRRHAHNVLTQAAGPWLDAFRMGSLIYIGTFVEGNSFNYRLLFLVFCIPQLVDWARLTSSAWLEARIGLVALFASCWGVLALQLVPQAVVLVLVQLANWVLFGALLYLLIVSLPDWLFGEIQHFFGKYDRLARSRSRIS